MNILIVEPHLTLLTPQGSRSRLDGLLSLLEGDQIFFLVPEGAELNGVDPSGVAYFREPSLFGKHCPYFLDWSPGFRSRLEQVVKEKCIDTVFFHFPWGLFSCARVIFPRRIVYFSAGVEADFVAVTLNHLRLNYLPFRGALFALVRFIEGLACRRADLVLTMSDLDINRYQELYQLNAEESAKFWTLPHPVSFSSKSPVFDVGVERRQAAKVALGLDPKRLVIAFHGLWSHLPNREAILSLVHDIAPLCIRNMGIQDMGQDVQFVVAGTGVPSEVGAHVKSLGFVQDLELFLSSIDIAVVPIYSGCGVRMKLFDYFSAGVPVVSTRKGAEGFGAPGGAIQDGKQLLLVEDSPQAVADGIMKLACDLELRTQLAQNAVNYLREMHDPEKMREQLCQRLGKNAGLVS